MKMTTGAYLFLLSSLHRVMCKALLNLSVSAPEASMRTSLSNGI